MDFRIMKATFKRNFMIQLRAYPMEFFIGNLLTALYTVLGAYFMYHLLFQGKMDDSFQGITGTADYMTYVILGSGIYLFVVRTHLNVSRSLITEMRTGTLESLMVAPFDRVGYFVGNMLQQTMTTSVELAISILFSIPFGINLSGVNISALLLAVVFSLAAYFGMSLILAAVMLYTRDTYISQNTLFLTIFVLCGITFPVEYLPRWAQFIAHFIPVTHSLKLIRGSTMMNMGILEQMDSLISLGLLAVTYSLIGFTWMKRVEKIALENTLA
ncbi:MAG: ABC transporter permease [Bacillota bacterium]